ncbi:threonine--tRNA ligase [Streptosporangium roseum]|uniref:Threonine--tRNA ligase n=1 Tax=Streptosporangium roseum (strain ATCC 12428 / DSM 43021 / JCM 3005 / KCTC 9067 / NCIMB 10171 / NRRL 2505 / NI 9100) TaxID=479432 RepID=D2AWT5_STRRD|nr:threonine--tRNA ligase [Streptosporangium roseum]ACZ88863.1 threonyl-tRNA synthetase [Streptosporangium roseum DSM 43021]
MSAVPELRITLAGAERVVAEGTTYGEALQADGRSVVAARANGELRDLAARVAEGDEVEPVEVGSPDGRAIVRHSTAHVMAQAVQELFPEAKLGIGPPVDNGFYYDFDVKNPFTPEDLKRVEKRMREIVKQGQIFSRRPVSDEDALEELAAEPYKLELIGLKGGAGAQADGADVEVGGAELTIYDNLDPKTGDLCWKDLCRGPHVPTTRSIPAFKLMRSGGAYWRGSEKNPQLQRIYGTAWESRDKQDEYLHMLEEAEKRDHRRLGAELDLFSFPSELGSGLPVFHPKGGIIRKEMEDYMRRRQGEAGYEFVNTPHITKSQLFETSGHLPWYAEDMFPPFELEGVEYRVKPMNCPMHNLIFRARGRSYRELPLRLCEFGSVYRYEKSGVVHGLTRVRGMTQDDSHIYCTREQMVGEIKSLLTFVLSVLRDFGLSEFYLELSTRDDSDKFIGDPADWDEATDALRQTALESGLELVDDPGGAAFYGPKISVQAKDAIGRTWQLSTIQLDLNQPKRFELEYQAADGSRQTPVMIHRALFGSIERFLGVLTEHYAGAFPPWLAPVQVVGIPIAEAHASYLQDVAKRARERGIRIEVDASDDRMQKKIRNAQKSKVPFMLLAGDEDIANGAVSFRFRNGEQKNGVPVDEAINEIVDAIERRIQV